MSLGSISTPFSVKARVPAKLRIACSLTAQNQFSTNVNNDTPQASTGLLGVLLYGSFALKLTGTWAGTVNVQRSTDAGVTWNDVTTGTTSPTVLTYTTNCIVNGFEAARDVLYRFGFKTGNYTSGTLVGEFEQ